jgi:transcriptional regulator with XRE-family HTH domain
MEQNKKVPRAGAVRSTISDQLRNVIHSRATAYATAKAAGVNPGTVSRFLSGKRSITLDTLDKIALALDLRLVEVGRRSPSTGADRAAVNGNINPTQNKAGMSLR